MSALDAFLAADRPGDVAIFLADAHLRNADALGDHAERVAGGYVLVLPGERGRRVFRRVAGDAPMEFAQAATEREGRVDPDLAGGRCPDGPAAAGGDDAPGEGTPDAGTGHGVRFVLAFAQERTEDVGGPYDEGDVIHAYARCACGTAYADRWVVGTRADPAGDGPDPDRTAS